MKYVKVLTNPVEEFEGDIVYKTDDSITLMYKGTIVFSVKEINNWDMFEIIGEIDKTEQQIMQDILDDVVLDLLK